MIKTIRQFITACKKEYPQKVKIKKPGDSFLSPAAKKAYEETFIKNK